MKQKKSKLQSTGHQTGVMMPAPLGLVLQRDKAQKLIKKLSRARKKIVQ